MLTLPPELTDRVRQYLRESGIGGTAQDAARELIAAALDYPEVESSLLRSARERGFLTARRDFLELGQSALAQMDSVWARQRREVGREGVGDGIDQRERDATG